MDFLTPHLEFFAAHPFGVVFFASLIEAAGIPFPSRIILILAPAFIHTDSDLPWLAVVAALGFVLGDHVPFLAGRIAGMRVLEIYCKVTLGSERCVETALGYFRRFGAPAVLIGRFSTSVRLFAAACAGCGHISYPRFLTFDSLGALLYTCVWVLVGSFIGEPAVEFFTRDPRRFTFLGLVLLVFAGVIGYRLWRRFKARSTASVSPAAIAQSRAPHTRPGSNSTASRPARRAPTTSTKYESPT
jgi:membrane protein DedA with SNARE-associated domain